MRRVIYKYEIANQGIFYLQLPQGYEVLHVGHQRNKPVMWALVDPEAPKLNKKFHVILTGEKFQFTPSYLGTFRLYKGDFIGHLFEVMDA